ncbi:hypothetical protein AB0H37_35040 [Actinomadura sp. NPDC023710]|uniref:hypothetical protein n=1 Tax=Actinomadura sp. NPDC023710 TaxID=3158219 RepID=UPI0033E6D68A
MLILLGSAVTTNALAVLPGPVPLLIAVAVLASTTRGLSTLLRATAVSDRRGTAAYGSLSGVLAARPPGRPRRLRPARPHRFVTSCIVALRTAPNFTRSGRPSLFREPLPRTVEHHDAD